MTARVKGHWRSLTLQVLVEKTAAKAFFFFGHVHGLSTLLGAHRAHHGGDSLRNERNVVGDPQCVIGEILLTHYKFVQTSVSINEPLISVTGYRRAG